MWAYYSFLPYRHWQVEERGKSRDRIIFPERRGRPLACSRMVSGAHDWVVASRTSRAGTRGQANHGIPFFVKCLHSISGKRLLSFWFFAPSYRRVPSGNEWGALGQAARGSTRLKPWCQLSRANTTHAVGSSGHCEWAVAGGPPPQPADCDLRRNLVKRVCLFPGLQVFKVSRRFTSRSCGIFLPAYYFVR